MALKDIIDNGPRWCKLKLICESITTYAVSLMSAKLGSFWISQTTWFKNAGSMPKWKQVKQEELQCSEFSSQALIFKFMGTRKHTRVIPFENLFYEPRAQRRAVLRPGLGWVRYFPGMCDGTVAMGTSKQ